MEVMRAPVRAAFVVAVATAACLFHAPSATAAPDAAPSAETIAEAERRFELGKQLYQENDFRGALVEFQRAWQLAPNYKLLYTIAQVQFQLQDYAAALQSFERYLELGRDEIPKARRDEVTREIDLLQARVARIEITTNAPGAVVSIDDVEVGSWPLPGPVLVSAGRRKISAVRGRAFATKMVDLAGGDKSEVLLELVEPAAPVPSAGSSATPPKRTIPTASASAAPPDTPPPAPPQAGRSVPWGLWAATGALTGAAVVTGVFALRSSNDLADKRERVNVGADALHEASSHTEAFAVTTDILAGAALVCAGVSLWLTLDRSAPSAPSTALRVSPRGVALSGSF